MVKYEIRQSVGSIAGTRLEVVHTDVSERMGRHNYKSITKNNPAEYFELIRVEHKEDCLEYTHKTTNTQGQGNSMSNVHFSKESDGWS